MIVQRDLKPPKLELAWAAGLFEGEGSVMISKPAERNWGTLRASVVNTDLQVVRFFADRWPGYCRAATGLKDTQRDAWVWLVAARRAAAFLEDIRPFIVRDKVKSRIDLGLQFQRGKEGGGGKPRSEQYAEDQWNAYWRMCELNTRGRDPDLPPRVKPRKGSPNK